MNLDLNGKNALVCGSTQGIGRATATELASLGATVTLVARNEEALQTTLATLDTTQGQKHDYLVADFSNPTQLQTVLQAYLQQNQKTIHILINNTGGPAGGALAQASTDAFRAAFDMHLICNHILATSVLDGMKQAGYGRIINVISTSVKQPLDNLGVSNTIRGAVANWSKTLANEVARFGVTVNNVLPGATATGRLQNIIHTKAQKTGHESEAVAQEMQAEIPMQRFAQPEEIAYTIAFLASPSAAYITGINVPVDGGRTKSL